MKNRFIAMLALGSLLMAVGLVAFAGDDSAKKEAPTVDEQIAGLQAMCKENAGPSAERQEKDSLYNRLGGYDKIHKLCETIIQNHDINEDIKHTMEGVDYDKLADHLADFISAGTGGTAEYTGRDMKSSHAHLELTDADFLSAGGDIVKSMKSMEYEQNEINDFLCILVSMKDQVVFK